MKIFLKQGQTNWKYILIVVILAVIVGAGILGWIKKQEAPPAEFPEIDETANWKIYQNMDYGYAIKYPAVASGHETGNGIRIENLPIITKESGIQEKSLNIDLLQNN